MAKKNYPEKRTYHRTKACPSTLKNSPYEGFFKSIVNCEGQKEAPNIMGLSADKTWWNGRCLWLYITRDALRGEFDDFDAQLVANEGVLSTFSRLRYEAPAPELVEIGVCCAAYVVNKRLKEFLDEYVEYCFRDRTDKHKYVKPFEFHSEVVAQIRNRLAPSDKQLYLDMPPKNDNISYYGNRAIESVLGRESEQKVLLDFLECDEQFSWFQLAGSGGQGKSRLALELVMYAQSIGWQAGFLDGVHAEDFRDDWEDWQPHTSHLIVLDYVVGRESSIEPALRALSRRLGALREDIRILLLERQRFDRGGFASVSNARNFGDIRVEPKTDQYATWYLKIDPSRGRNTALNKCRFRAGVEELSDLGSDYLVDIVEKVAALVAGHSVSVDRSRVAKQLLDIGAAGRALYAYFLGLPAGHKHREELNTQESLLDYVLKVEFEKRWPAEFQDEPPKLRQDTPALRLAVLATIVGKLDVVHAPTEGVCRNLSEQIVQSALTICGSPRDEDGTAVEQWIVGMEPDILGEWFVLKSFKGSVPLGDLLESAWLCNPDGLARFIERLICRFYMDPKVKDILLNLPEIDSSEVLGGALVSAFGTLYEKALPLPLELVETIKLLAESNNRNLTYLLGEMYRFGVNVSKDYAAAEYWLGLAANKGNVAAWHGLGMVCLHNGHTNFDSYSEALKWLRMAASEGHSYSCYQIGWMYIMGEGVERNSKRGLAWIRYSESSRVSRLK